MILSIADPTNPSRLGPPRERIPAPARRSVPSLPAASVRRIATVAAAILASAVAPVLALAGDATRQADAGEAAVLAAGLGCQGSGLEGTLASAGTVVHFESCATATGAVSVVRDDLGRPLTEFAVDGKTVTFRIGGMVVDDASSEAEWDRMAAVLQTPEAALAGRLLWSKLVDAGYLETGGTAMAALRANLTAYEYVEPQDAGGGDCLGCCGNGCSGCMGCYTQLCYQHDRCIRRYGGGIRAHIRCFYLLPAAAFSAWECR